MKYKLSEFVGRNQLPGDEVAFNRLAEIFGDDDTQVVNCCRRKREPAGHKLTRLAQDKRVKPAN